MMEPATRNSPTLLVTKRVVLATLLFLGTIASLTALGMPTIPRNGILKGERFGEFRNSKIA